MISALIMLSQKEAFETKDASNDDGMINFNAVDEIKNVEKTNMGEDSQLVEDSLGYFSLFHQ